MTMDTPGMNGCDTVTFIKQHKRLSSIEGNRPTLPKCYIEV